MRSVPNELCLQEQIGGSEQVLQGPTFQHLVAEGSVVVEHRIAGVPLTARLRVKPDETTAALADVAESPGLRIKSVIAGISENQNDRVPGEGIELVTVELVKRPAKVTEAKEVQSGIPTQSFEVLRKTHAVEQRRDIDDAVDEYQAADAGEFGL